MNNNRFVYSSNSNNDNASRLRTSTGISEHTLMDQQSTSYASVNSFEDVSMRHEKLNQIRGELKKHEKSAMKIERVVDQQQFHQANMPFLGSSFSNMKLSSPFSALNGQQMIVPNLQHVSCNNDYETGLLIQLVSRGYDAEYAFMALKLTQFVSVDQADDLLSRLGICRKHNISNTASELPIRDRLASINRKPSFEDNSIICSSQSPTSPRMNTTALPYNRSRSPLQKRTPSPAMNSHVYASQQQQQYIDASNFTKLNSLPDPPPYLEASRQRSHYSITLNNNLNINDAGTSVNNNVVSVGSIANNNSSNQRCGRGISTQQIDSPHISITHSPISNESKLPPSKKTTILSARVDPNSLTSVKLNVAPVAAANDAGSYQMNYDLQAVDKYSGKMFSMSSRGTNINNCYNNPLLSSSSSTRSVLTDSCSNCTGLLSVPPLSSSASYMLSNANSGYFTDTAACSVDDLRPMHHSQNLVLSSMADDQQQSLANSNLLLSNHSSYYSVADLCRRANELLNVPSSIISSMSSSNYAHLDDYSPSSVSTKVQNSMSILPNSSHMNSDRYHVDKSLSTPLFSSRLLPQDSKLSNSYYPGIVSQHGQEMNSYEFVQQPMSYRDSVSPESTASTESSLNDHNLQDANTADKETDQFGEMVTRISSPLPEGIRKKLDANQFESYTRPVTSQAFRFFMEQHVENVIKQHKERQKRRLQLEKELARGTFPEQFVFSMRQLLNQKESQYLRMKRQRLDKTMFQNLKIIGQGAFGEVVLVKKSDMKALYAMKILRKSQVIKKNQAAHVKAERDILSEADNEWVVKLFYSFQDKDNLFLIMEYIPGGDLMALLIKKGIFDEPLAKFYTAELVCAIESVHKLKFIHRDIKPDNILIDRDGHIKLTDFGLCTGLRWTHESKYYKHSINKLNEHESQDSYDLLAKISDRCQDCKLLDYRHEQQRLRCKAHSLVGTPNYIAPEVLERTGHTELCDWWSVGVILYEMLVGCPPFQASTAVETQNKIINWRENLIIPDDSVRPMSPEARRLIRELCCDQRVRLGKNGAQNLKDHLFFKGIDWTNLRQLPAPYRPEIKSPTDTSNFDPVAPRNDQWAHFSEESICDHAFYEFTFRRFFDYDGHGCPTLRINPSSSTASTNNVASNYSKLEQRFSDKKLVEYSNNNAAYSIGVKGDADDSKHLMRSSRTFTDGEPPSGGRCTSSFAKIREFAALSGNSPPMIVGDANLALMSTSTNATTRLPIENSVTTSAMLMMSSSPSRQNAPALRTARAGGAKESLLQAERSSSRSVERVSSPGQQRLTSTQRSNNTINNKIQLSYNVNSTTTDFSSFSQKSSNFASRSTATAVDNNSCASDSSSTVV